MENIKKRYGLYDEKFILELADVYWKNFPSPEKIEEEYPEIYEWFMDYGTGWFTEMTPFDAAMLSGAIAFIEYKKRKNG